jgi:hypothetical protein
LQLLSPGSLKKHIFGLSIYGQIHALFNEPGKLFWLIFKTGGSISILNIPKFIHALLKFKSIGCIINHKEEKRFQIVVLIVVKLDKPMERIRENMFYHNLRIDHLS